MRRSFPALNPRFATIISALISVFTASTAPMPVSAMEASTVEAGPSNVPAWVFPLNAAATANPVVYDDRKPLRLPNSRLTFTEAQLNDLFDAPDWHPASHGAMPSIVSRGHPPDVYACGFCHTAGGQGRPENASLAGLPAAYIISQVMDFKSGARKSAWRGPYRPADLMIHTATHATAEEISAAADYFAAQSLKPRVDVVERKRVPRSDVVGWVYATDTNGGYEPLGDRLLEFAPDAIRHEHRDDEMRYVAYVPPGSIRRGKHLALSGADSPVTACASCHGPALRGTGLVPPLAGRSPTYILRQLLAFKSGARSGATGLPMRAVVRELNIGSMIDAAAYAASLPP